MSTAKIPTSPRDQLDQLRGRRHAPKRQDDGAPVAPPVSIDVPAPTDVAPAGAAAVEAPAPRPTAAPTARSGTEEWRVRIQSLEINPDLALVGGTQKYRREVAHRAQDLIQRLRTETGTLVKRAELVELAVMMMPDDVDEVADALRELRRRGERPGPGPAPMLLD